MVEHLTRTNNTNDKLGFVRDVSTTSQKPLSLRVVTSNTNIEEIVFSFNFLRDGAPFFKRINRNATCETLDSLPYTFVIVATDSDNKTKPWEIQSQSQWQSFRVYIQLHRLTCSSTESTDSLPKGSVPRILLTTRLPTVLSGGAEKPVFFSFYTQLNFIARPGA